MKKLLRILDGTVAEYGVPNKGQSIVELALFMPILIVLLAGLIELGWYTNNYLILLEVSRVGARFGTNLVDNSSPLSWEANRVTYETVESNVLVRRPIPTRNGTLPPNAPGLPATATGNNTPNVTDAQLVRDCENGTGFYEAIACLVVDSLDPLELNTVDPTVRDDIVISVFSTNLLPNPTGTSTATQANLTSFGNSKPFLDPGQTSEFRNSAPGGAANAGNAPQVMVTGRYPAMTNECTGDHRDPFDLNRNNTMDTIEADAARRSVMDPDRDGTRQYALLDASTNEVYRGFVYTGKWTVPNSPGCYGSAWTIRRIETLVNLRGLGLNVSEMGQLPGSQAFVLVEVNWRHQLLLAFPGFSPLMQLLGGENGSYISTWAAFPVPAAEFRMDLDQTSAVLP